MWNSVFRKERRFPRCPVRPWAQAWTFARGRIIRWALFPDKAAALEAAGRSK
jgi:hypothetical protein